MSRIAAHEFMALDGVVEDPRWTMDYPFDPRMGEAIAACMPPGSAILLGRRTYEMFEPAWSTRTAEDDPGAPMFNESPKYFVSGTLKEAGWRNSEVLGPYDPEAVRGLKDRYENIYVSGSIQLVRALLRDRLVDELHLFVYPVALGAGLQLFARDGGPTRLELLGSESYASGVVHLAYGPAR